MAYTTIDDSSAHFQISTWSGNASTQSITNDGNSDLKPDWAWTKDGIGYGHKLMDSSRGLGSSGKFLITNSSAAESAIDDYMMTFDTDGFSVGAGDSGFNASNDTYVTWQWKAAGGTTASNSVGDISSTVQANTTAGFSIVTYTGNGNANQTIGHGLGAVPKMILFKNRSNTAYWYVYHVDTGNDTMTYLNLSNAAQSLSSQFSTPTTTTFNVSNENSTFNGYNTNGDNYVAYVFAEIQGYSKFGKYEGNGSSNGPFIYTGFKPAFVIVKNADGTTDWRMNGPDGKFFSANTASAVYDSAPGPIDRVSNGFKIRGGDDLRANGNTFIYMAWATNPFVTSTGIPTTAGSTGPAT